MTNGEHSSTSGGKRRKVCLPVMKLTAKINSSGDNSEVIQNELLSAMPLMNPRTTLFWHGKQNESDDRKFDVDDADTFYNDCDDHGFTMDDYNLQQSVEKRWRR